MYAAYIYSLVDIEFWAKPESFFTLYFSYLSVFIIIV
jgi:hypothetical protein